MRARVVTLEPPETTHTFVSRPNPAESTADRATAERTLRPRPVDTVGDTGAGDRVDRRATDDVGGVQGRACPAGRDEAHVVPLAGTSGTRGDAGARVA
jgi:hypothetical protein